MTLTDTPLWDETLVRVTDPETSRLAAASVDKAGSQMMVLRCLAATGPLADHEIEERINANDFLISPSRVRTARHGLEVRGLVEFAGMYSKTPAGNATRIWVVTGLGHHEIAKAGR